MPVGTQCDNCSYGPLEKCKIDEAVCPTKELFIDFAKHMGVTDNSCEDKKERKP